MKYEMAPYSRAARMARRKLRWDLSLSGLMNRRKAKQWKNKYAGKKVVLLCNGPSLNKVDFQQLEETGIPTIGLNKINLVFDRTSFRPTFIVAMNPLVIEQNSSFFNKTELPLFLDWASYRRDAIQDRLSTIFLYAPDVFGTFSTDITSGINKGSTVTFSALQVAYYLGFSQVGLVGCDHSFASKGPANKTVQANADDVDHFDPRYFSNGMKWQLPDLIGSEYHYQVADFAFREAGRVVYNCTDGGFLEVFQRKELSDFLRPE